MEHSIKFHAFGLLCAVTAFTTTTAQAACNTPWVRYAPYVKGDVVKYTNNSTYIAKFDNPGYDPTISTYFWAPQQCAVTPPPPPPPAACASTPWVRYTQYAKDTIVKYTDGRLFVAKFSNPGYDPTISTYFWAPYFCAGTPPGSGQWTVIGSSSAAGSGAQSLSWVNGLGQHYSSRSVTITNLAQSGTVTYQGLPSSTAPVAHRPAPISTVNIDAALSWTPKVVFISYPTNDTMNGYSVDETVANILTMRSKARQAGAAVIVVSTQPRIMTPAQRATLVQIDERLSTEVAACFVAVREALSGADGALRPEFDSGDGIHLNDAGHAVIRNKAIAVIDAGNCVTVAS